MRLLYVSDRRVDSYLIKALREAGHVVEATGQPEDGEVMAADAVYQAIVLDWSVLPTNEVARFAAASGSSEALGLADRAIVVVIAASGDQSERARLLKAGADAVLMRPIAFIELEARLEALARLVQRVRPAAAGYASVELILAERAVRLNGRHVALSQREFRVLEHLVAHAGEAVSLERLHLQVWGDEGDPRPDRVRACVARLRRKLEAAGAGAVLRAVASHGYVFLPASVPASVPAT